MRGVRSVGLLLLWPLVLVCSIFVLGGVVASGTSVEEAVDAATASLQRQVESLQEKLETYEMKHDTLEAATSQFRIQAKSTKQKLEEERKRYDTI
ncbi:MAG: hypothetical protein SGILL_007456, partial [Bacillariaceae sp.]